VGVMGRKKSVRSMIKTKTVSQNVESRSLELLSNFKHETSQGNNGFSQVPKDWQ